MGREEGSGMKIGRRSFLGGSIASIGLLFGGFGWREPEGPFPSTREVQEWGEQWGRSPSEDALEDQRALNRLARAMVEERFPTDAHFEEMMKPPPVDFVPMPATEVVERFVQGEMSWDEFHEERGFTLGVDREKYAEKYGA